MAVPGSLRLSREEAWKVITDSHTGIFTSLRRDGSPITLAVWFVAFDERVYIGGPSHRKKFARIRHDPRVSFLVESGKLWKELVGVHITGRARIVTEPELLERVSAELNAKYAAFRSPRPSMPEETRAAYETQHTTIEIVPDDRILSWDNSRIDLSQ
jgi:hypothetical protein